MRGKSVKNILIFVLGALCFGAAVAVFAASGIGAVAAQAKSNLGSVAQLVTAGAYLAGMAFGVAAIVKFKAHKDTPTQVHIGQPIALLFVAAALMFLPSVFSSLGGTLYQSGAPGGISGFSSFGGE
jgi:intracellular multiplication protein IcmD